MAKANTFGKAIGTISGLNGKATATSPRGETRVLKNGDSVFENEKVTAQDGSSIHINLANSGFATIGAGDSITFNANTLADAARVAKEDAPANDPTAISDAEIEAVQALIAKGVDPVDITEAAAAGPQSSRSAGDEGSHFVIVSQNAARGEVTPGFGTDTLAFSAAASDIETAAIYSMDLGGEGGNSGGGGNSSGGNNGGGTVTPPPPPINLPYTERMVMYMDSANLSGNPNSMKMVAKANTGQHVDSTDTPTSTHSYGDVNIVGSSIEFTLNAAGQAALDALAPGAHLVDYITYKGLDGQEYVIQVVLTNDAPGQFDFDTLADYDSKGTQDIPGETHYGHAADGQYDVRTSDGNDVFESQSMHDSKIVMGKGSDTVVVNGNVKDSTIALGSTDNAADMAGANETNTLDITGNVSGSHIYGTAGTEKVTIDSATGITLSGSDIHLGEGNNALKITSAGSGAVSNSSITAGNGNNEVTISAKSTSTEARGMSGSSITAGNGNNTINVTAESVSGDAVGMHNASIIAGNNSTIDITADSTQNRAYGVRVNTSSTLEGGDITINATGKEYAQALTVGSNGTFKADADGKFMVSATTTNPSNSSSPTTFGVIGNGNNAKIDISAQDVEITGDSTHRGVYTASAYSGANVNITGEDSVSISSKVDYSSNTDLGSIDAIGVLSTNGGKITVTGSDIDINAVVNSARGSATAVYSGGGGSSTTIQGHHDKSNSINIDAKGELSTAIMASQDGKVYIKGGDMDDTIHITAESAGNSTAWGLFGDVRGQSVITGGAGNDTLTIKAINTGSGNAEAMAGYYGTAGWGHAAKHTIQGIENVSIEATANGGNASGMISHAGGANTIKDANGALTFTVKAETKGTGTAEAIWANAGTNSISGNSMAGQTGDTFTVEAKSVNGTATGMKAVNGGVNSITGGASANDKLTLSATTTGSGVATGLSAESGGKNTITDIEDVAITAQSDSGTAYGLYASGGTNSIDNATNVTIDANNTGSTSVKAYGIYAGNSGSNTISSKDISIFGKTSGVFASGNGKNTITGQNGTVSITGNNGLEAINSGENKIIGGAGINDKLIISATVSGLRTDNIGKNTISGMQDIDITATNTSGSAYGLNALSSSATNSVNTLTGNDGTNGKLSISATGSFEASGLSAQVGGQNIITGIEDINITVESGMALAYGLYAQASSARNSITGSTGSNDNKLTISVTTTGAMATGLGASNTGANEITGIENVAIKAETSAYGYAYGLHAATLNATNSITGNTGSNDNKLTISAIADLEAAGLYAHDNGKNTITGFEDIDITVKSTSDNAYGLYATRDKTNANTITGSGSGSDKLAISVTGGKEAAGLSAIDNGKNTITGIGSVDISVTSTSNQAYGLKAHKDLNANGGKNFIEAADVDIDVKSLSNNHNAYGMFAGAGSENRIEAIAGQDFTVSITVAAGQGAKAYAMYAAKAATAGAGNNVIDGRDATNSDIFLKGDILTDGTGKNTIYTSDGNNTITIDGTVSKGGLTLVTGSGHDTLILTASNLGEFNTRFKSWLTDLALDPSFKLSIDSVQVNLPDGFIYNPADFSWLTNIFDAPGQVVFGNSATPAAETYAAAADLLPDPTPDDGPTAQAESAVTGTDDTIHAATTSDDSLPDNTVTDKAIDLSVTTDTDNASSLHATHDNANEVDSSNNLSDKGNPDDTSLIDDSSLIIGDIIGDNTLNLGDVADPLHPESALVEDGTPEGADTLYLNGEHAISNLTDIDDSGNTLDSLTAIDLRGGSDDILHLDTVLTGLGGALDGEVSGSTDLSALINASDSVLLVNKDATDQVIVENAVWEAQGAVDYNGASYDVYHNSSNEYVLVQQDQVHTGPF